MEERARAQMKKGQKSDLLKIMKDKDHVRFTSSVWAEAIDRKDELATELIDAKIPVAIVLMTGFADSGIVSEASLTHSLPVLRKPFEVEELAVIIDDALSRRCDQPGGC